MALFICSSHFSPSIYCSSRSFLRWFILSVPPRVSPLLKFPLVFLLFVQRALSLVFYSLQVPPLLSLCLSERWEWLHPSPIFFFFSLWVVGIYVYGVWGCLSIACRLTRAECQTWQHAHMHTRITSKIWRISAMGETAVKYKRMSETKWLKWREWRNKQRDERRLKEVDGCIRTWVA